jgi:hypothetical protein
MTTGRLACHFPSYRLAQPEFAGTISGLIVIAGTLGDEYKAAAKRTHTQRL